MTSQAPRRAIFVVFPGCEILDLAGPVQVLHEATALGARYALSYHAATPTVQTAQGLELGGLEALPDVGPGERVIVPGFPRSGLSRATQARHVAPAGAAGGRRAVLGLHRRVRVR